MYNTKCLDLWYGARAEFRQNSPLIKLANWGGGPLKTITTYRQQAALDFFTSTLAYQTSLVCITRLTLTTQTSNIVLLPFFFKLYGLILIVCALQKTSQWKKVVKEN